MRHFTVLIAALIFAAPAGAEAPVKCPLDAAYDPQNPFAKISRGELRGGIVYQDRQVIAFIPINWDNPGHVLVIPRRPIRNLADMSDADLLAVFHLIRRIAVAQQRAFGATGYSVEQNNGRHQTVCHAHFHVIPNTPEEKVEKATPEQREAIAARLRAALPQ